MNSDPENGDTTAAPTLTPTARQVNLASLLRNLVQASRALRSPEGASKLIPGSMAFEEDQAWRATHEEPADRLITEALASGFRLLVAAEHHLEGMADFAGYASRGFPTLTLARACIEAVSLAHWMLDPRIGAEERSRRAAHQVRDAAGAARTFSTKTRIEFDAKDVKALDELFGVAASVEGGVASRPNWEQLARSLAGELGLEARLSDSGFGVLVDAAHTGKNARDTIVPSWTSDGVPDVQFHPITEWAYWFAGNLYAAAVLRAGELLGWPELDAWLADVTRIRAAMQRLFNEVKAERMGEVVGD